MTPLQMKVLPRIQVLNDGNVVIQERDINNLPRVTYTRGNDLSGSLQGAGGIGGLLARSDNTQMIIGSPTAHAFYHADGNGNVTMLINSYQAIVAKYLYDPFGNTLSLSGSLADANVYRFSSKEWNDNAGLYYYLYRYYDPNLQRWLNQDPIQERGGLSLYEYVANNPINLIDLLGLCDQNLADLLQQLQNELNQLDLTEAGLGLDPNLQLLLQLNQLNQSGWNYDDTASTLGLLGLAQFSTEYGSGAASIGINNASGEISFYSHFYGNQSVSVAMVSDIAHYVGYPLAVASVYTDYNNPQTSTGQFIANTSATMISFAGPVGAAFGVGYGAGSLIQQPVNDTVEQTFQIFTDSHYGANNDYIQPIFPNP
jgi:RHS repeat-associated protein